jgi:purine-cytosine permease-like protein
MREPDARIQEPAPTDRILHIERRGIGTIPDSARHSRPATVGIVFFGTQLTYGTLIVGALPLAFGLGWWASLSTILLGTLIGTAGFAAMIPIGSRTGTNGTVSSGAFFGIRGRYIGSLVTQIVDLGYFAMTFWISAPPLVAAGQRCFGIADSNLATLVALVVSVACILALAVFGHATIVAYEKLTSVAGILAIAVLVLFAGFNLGTQHHVAAHYALGSFWPTWTMAITAQIANAISYGPFASDYSRYVPSTASARAQFGWAFAGMFGGNMLTLVAGACIGMAVADPKDIIGGMIGFLPLWLVLPVTVCAFIANTANGSMVVYNGILDLHAMLWRLKWVQVACIFSTVGVGIGCLGLVIADFTDRIDALCSVVTILVTPWMMINIIGYLQHRGRFNPQALQDFTHRDPHNPYWYMHGFSRRAVIAWAASTLVGMLFSNTHLFVGPLASLAGGADLSCLSSAVVGALLYLALDSRLEGRATRSAQHGLLS